MPFATAEQVIQPRSRAARRIVELPSHPLHNTFLEVAHAAVDQSGLTWNAVNFLSRNRSYPFDPSYRPFEDKEIEPWTRLYPEAFDSVVSKPNAMDVVSRLQREHESKRILQQAGGAGVMASLGAGILDPINFIPLSWIGRIASGAKSVQAAKVAVALKQGGLVADDAVRLGVQLTADELRVVRGVGVAEVTPIGGVLREAETIREVGALGRMGVRAGERAEVRAGERLALAEEAAGRDVAREIAGIRALGISAAERTAAASEARVASAAQAGRELTEEVEAVGRAAIEAGETELKERGAHIAGLEVATQGKTKKSLFQPQFEDVRRVSAERPRGYLMEPPVVLQIEATAKVAQARRELAAAQAGVVERRVELEKTLGEAGELTAEGVADAKKNLATAEKMVERRRAEFESAKGGWDTALRDMVAQGRVDEARIQVASAIEVTERRKFRAVQALTEGEARLQAARVSATAEGEARMAAIRASQAGVAAKIGEHKKLVDAARKTALSDLPSPFSHLPSAIGGGAAVGAGFSGVSEVFLQAVQEGREDELIANSFIAGGILGGVLSGSLGLMAAMGQRRLLTVHEAMVEELTAGSAFQRMVDDDLLSPEEVRAFMVAGKVEGKLPRGTMAAGSQEERAGLLVDTIADRVAARSPSTAKMLKDESSFLRRAMRQIVLSPAGRMSYAAENNTSELAHLMFGLPYLKGREPIAPSVAARIQTHMEVAQGFAYQIGKLRGKADRAEFSRGVANYIRSGGKTEATAEMIQAADLISKYHGDFLKTLQKDGLLENVDLGADVGYFTRVWNHDAIRANRQQFLDLIQSKVGGYKKANEIVDELLANGPAALSIDSFNLTGVTGQLKARELLNVPSVDVADFLIDDLEFNLNRYAHQVGSQLEVARLTPTGSALDRLNMTEWKDRVNKGYQKLIDEAKTPRQKARLLKEHQQTMLDLEFSRESFLGFLSRDPYNAADRGISSALTTGASVMYLGNAGFNSLNDITGSAFANGARPWLRVAVGRLRRTLAGMPKDDLAREAYLYQFMGGEHSKHAMIFDSIGDGSNAPGGHGGLWRKVHNSWMLVNGLRFVTGKAAEHGTYVAIDELLRISRSIASGTAITKAQRNNLALSGLDEATASLIGKKVLEGGAVEQEGVLLARLSAWGDDELAQTFRAAVSQNVHRAVMNPGRAEVPMVFRSSLGRVLFQFFQFPTAATQNFLVSGLQRHDAAVVTGGLMMLGMGVFIQAVNYASRGQEIPELESLIAEGADRSGIFGLLPSMNQWAASLTGGIADVNHLFGTRTIAERYGTKDPAELVPGFSMLSTIQKQIRTSVRLLNGEEIGEQEAAVFSRRWPGMNAVYATPIREIIEAAVQSER